MVSQRRRETNEKTGGLPDNNLTLFKRRVYLSGFADHDLNFGAGPDHNTWVTEHQLGIRLVGGLHAVAEFRRNEYLPEKRNGMGLGLEYLIHFGETP